MAEVIFCVTCEESNRAMIRKKIERIIARGIYEGNVYVPAAVSYFS